MGLKLRSSQLQYGFSLIELMIVLVIAGVLFFVALPAYQNSILKSNRSVGRGVLMDVVSRQEQFFINNKSYATSLEDLGLDPDRDDKYLVDDKAQAVTAESDAIYRIEIIAISTLAYSATPLSRQVKDRHCNILTLEQIGTRDVSGATLTKSECW
ncbi:MAG: hypothetical protein DRQ97_09830 [Gammaproteobacteria bacterium]|nr:MAG: hypothetical protein DRQ97_09830 [Gammaproteobacteria bacterium]